MGTDMMDLTLVARQARWNSERWFPELHDGSSDMGLHYTLGLAGEIGEVCNLFKRIQTGKPKDKDDLGAELADVFTYLILLADECDIDLMAAFEAKQAVCEGRWG